MKQQAQKRHQLQNPLPQNLRPSEVIKLNLQIAKWLCINHLTHDSKA